MLSLPQPMIKYELSIPAVENQIARRHVPHTQRQQIKVEVDQNYFLLSDDYCAVPNRTSEIT
jgi:hypothetical protein